MAVLVDLPHPEENTDTSQLTSYTDPNKEEDASSRCADRTREMPDRPGYT